MKLAVSLLLLLTFVPSAFASGASRPRVTTHEAATLFNRFANLSGIDWNHTQSGCFERARLMARELDRLDIYSVKIFIEEARHSCRLNPT